MDVSDATLRRRVRLRYATGQKWEAPMPFDGQNTAFRIIPLSLETALIESAIEPVAPHVLVAHKA